MITLFISLLTFRAYLTGVKHFLLLLHFVQQTCIYNNQWYGDHSVVTTDLSVVVSDKSYPQGVIYVMPLVYSNHPQRSHDLLTWSAYLSCICLAGIKPGWASVSIWSTRRAWGAKTASHDTQWDHMMQYNKYLPPIRVIMINDLQDVSPTKG